MKEEKEIKWIVNLLHSKELSNTWFDKKGGSFPDYEEIANNSTRDKEFSVWFKKLVNKKIIIFSENRINVNGGSPTKIYLLEKNKLYEYLKEFELWKRTKDIAVKNL